MKATADLSSLLNDILHSGAALRIKVTGTSMAPFIRGGETVTLVRSAQYRTGDLVFFNNHQSRLTLHRIICSRRNHSGNRLFQTKGDAVGYFDNPLPVDQILGKVIEIEKKAPFFGCSLIRISSPFWRLTSRFIVIKTLFQNHPIYAMARPYFNPQLVNLYRAFRVRLTA